MRGYDVAVLGGGPAGCAAARALRRRGVERVLVVEAGRFDDVRVGESIPPDTRLPLAELGLWDDFAAEGHEPCLGSCSSWGDARLGYNDFLCNPLGAGWHLDRRRFDAFLARGAAQAGAEIRTATRCAGVERAAGGFRLRLAAAGGAAETIAARLVVDATGAGSRFARSLGAARCDHDRLFCVTGFFLQPPAAGLSRLTLLEAVEDGWWYAARLPGGRLAVALATDLELLRARGLSEPRRWLAALLRTDHLAPTLAGCRPASSRLYVRCAPSCRLDRAAGDGWLAAGDAASAYDPLSSQGIHKSLTTGIEAAAALASALAGDDGPLVAYGGSVASRFAGYLANRNHFYGREERWADAPFWRRRRERSALTQ